MPPWRGQGGTRATRVPGALGPPPASSSSYIYPSDQKTPRQNRFLETYICSAAVTILISGGDRRTCYRTLPEEEDHPGGLYFAMTASQMMCE